ncbi:amino acid ABC transporter permease [Mycolicibacterium neoaurum]|uniref:amino acid ABC transporter permease n=1 Tax=Mycolicibacterium neoaurum TaxID=1795 RepID=UPI00248AB522|nr:amino acid ABC transporter permease [Mycolicibacterium neoaurum]WBP93351.1 amino acid ABC transporter permease [Mycolicibacterium neoaurum]WBS06973.1 amino acid ABC transporter permease [Mycolicibacterium neoaurum]
MNVLIDNLDLYVNGFLGTIKLFIVSAMGSLLLGTVLAAGRVSPVPVFRSFSVVYVNTVRNTPLTLVLFFFAFAYPRLELLDLSFFARACIGLTLYTSAFVCEVLRSGVNTVPVGQAEASRALGFTFSQTLVAVVLPQAVRSVVPPMTNILVALLKNTTVAAGFSVVEAGGIYANLSERGYNVFIGLLWVAAGFIVLVIPLTLLQRNLSNKWSVAK